MAALFSPTVSPTRFSLKTYIHIHTPSGIIPFPVHATVLASASPVLKEIVTSNSNVKICGVPTNAAIAFIHFIYTSRCSRDDMKNYGIHLLVLSHVFSMPKLKQRCIVDLIQFITTRNVVDVLHLAKLCDAPNLYFKCVKLVTNNFEAVKKTEGWKLLHKHDPWLEVDIIHLNKEQVSRKKRGNKHREEQKLIVQLSEAVQCLEHICIEGCTNVASYDVEITGRQCTKFSICQALQGLIKHFTTCNRRLEGGCRCCKPMWQLFRLHSCICFNQDTCKVPLCRKYQLIAEKENKEGATRWKLIVGKVASTIAMSSLQLLRTRREEVIRNASVEEEEEEDQLRESSNWWTNAIACFRCI